MNNERKSQTTIEKILLEMTRQIQKERKMRYYEALETAYKILKKQLNEARYKQYPF